MFTRLYYEHFSEDGTPSSANKVPPIVANKDEKYIDDPEKRKERDMILDVAEE